MRSETITLTLFFTRSVSLETWVASGLFMREKLLYEKHLKDGVLNKVYWLTYGSNDTQIAKDLKRESLLHKDIEVLSMPSVFKIPLLGSYLYSIILPIIHREEIKRSNILKTNQMDGSWSAVLAKLLYKKPLIVRTGYTLSLFAKRQGGVIFKRAFICLVEKLAYRFANTTIVTSKQDAEYIYERHGVTTKILPNYIDTNRFFDKGQSRYENKLVFVGRLNKQKNLFNLIEAVHNTNLSLDIYGEGELEEELKKFAIKNGANVHFKGTVANNDLPDVLNKYKYFVLPSLYEGMPKTLLEAMSCGCVCIGTDVCGINEVIEDGTNGYLSTGTSIMDLQKAIELALQSKAAALISIKAVKTIYDKYSLYKLAKNEQELIVKSITR